MPEKTGSLNKTDLLIAGGLGLIHLAFALIYRTWADFHTVLSWGGGTMQLMPMEALRENLPDSLWYLHAQPPLFNLYGWIWGTIAPHSYLEWIYSANIVLGVVITMCAFLIAAHLIGNRIIAFVITLFYVATSVDMLLFEPVIFYTMLTLLLTTSAIAFLTAFAASKRIGYLYGVVMCLTTMILVRSAFNVVLILVGIPFLAILAEQHWRKVVLVSLLISLPAFAWYTKNLAVFGFWGSSSWMGSNLWRIAEVAYANDKLLELGQDGLIDPVVAEVIVFGEPSRYVPYGFDKTSSHAVLMRQDYNNINMIAVSETYGKNALILIRHRPLLYLRTVYNAYKIFARPLSNITDTYDLYLSPNAIHVEAHTTFNHKWLQGQIVTDQINKWIGSEEITSPLMIILPLVVASYLLGMITRCKFSVRRWIEYVRRDPVMIAMVMLIIYVVAIGSFLEYGENNRFRMEIEPLIWIFVATVAYRLALQLMQRKSPHDTHNHTGKNNR